MQTATAKGTCIGALVYRAGADATIDCRRTSTLITADAASAQCLQKDSRARFVLVVEKDSVYQRLIDEGFVEKFAPCILITARGYPDHSTRQLLQAITRDLNIETYALVDADVHGLHVTGCIGIDHLTVDISRFRLPMHPRSTPRTSTARRTCQSKTAACKCPI